MLNFECLPVLQRLILISAHQSDAMNFKKITKIVPYNVQIYFFQRFQNKQYILIAHRLNIWQTIFNVLKIKSMFFDGLRYFMLIVKSNFEESVRAL